MPIKKTYALLDHNAQYFMLPLSFVNDGEAIRWFTTVVNSEDKTQAPTLYPEQFSLYRLADYDDQSGMFVPRENENETIAMKPKEIVTGVQVKNEESKTFTVEQLITLLDDRISKSVNEIGNKLTDQIEVNK